VNSLLNFAIFAYVISPFYFWKRDWVPSHSRDRIIAAVLPTGEAM